MGPVGSGPEGHTGSGVTGAGAQPDWAYAQIDRGAPATGAANPAAEGGSGKATAGLCRGAGQEPVAEVGVGSGGRAGRATGRFDGALADDTAAARGASGVRVSVCFDQVRARSEVRGTGARAVM